MSSMESTVFSVQETSAAIGISSVEGCLGEVWVQASLQEGSYESELFSAGVELLSITRELDSFAVFLARRGFKGSS